ncbi:MAG: PAS domain S-box protein [Promethearchaeota archaeon]|jgi:PAS domain S-box-containing protein
MSKLKKEKKVNSILEQESRLWQTTFDALNDSVFIIDLSHKILQCNKATLDFFKISSIQDVIGRSCCELLHNKTQPVEWCPMISMIESGVREAFTAQIGDKWVEISADPILDDENKIIGAIHLMTDITQNKLTEIKLRESESRYRLISENAYDMVSILNDQIKYEFVNEQAFLKTMGRSRKDLLGKRPLKWAHPEDIEKCITTFKEGFKSGEATIQARFKDINGKYLWLDIKGKTFSDFDGKKKALIISRDITDQKQARDKLIESEEKFRTITEHSNLGIMIIQNGKFKYVNQAMSIINGYTIEEMLDWSMKDMINLVHPDDLPNVTEQFNRNLSSIGNQFVNKLYRMITKDGSIKWLESFGKEIKFKGKYAGLISVIDRTDVIETELKLKESEERYRLIYENANDLIRVLNDRFEFEYLNEKVHKRILGYSKEDLIGHTHLPFLHPDDRRHAMRSTVRNLKKGEGSYQARFKDKKGMFRWFEFSGTLFFDSKGEKKILSIARDISERKTAEEELKNSEERYRIISQNAEENLFIFDMNMNLIYNDTSVPNILGYTYEEMRDLKLKDYNTSSSLKVTMDAYKEEIRNERKNLKDPKRIRTFEIEQIHKDGSIVNVETRFTFLRDEKGKATGILGLSKNITKRKQAEKKLSESEEKYRLISETAYDLIGIMNKRFKYEYINENAFKQILGYSSSEILGKSALKFVHPDDVSKIAKTLFEGFKKGEGGAALRFKHKEGHWVWIEAKGKTFLDRDGKLKAIVISRDITEQKKSEEQLKESETKYREAYNRATFYKDLFGHDMNNILTVINSSVDLIPYYLGESEKSKNIRSVINILQNQVNRGAKLISNVNALSELEESVIPIEQVKINKYLENSIKFIKTSFKERDLKINVDSNGLVFKAQANQLLREIFDNILINAIRYNDNTTVEILIKVSEETLDNSSLVRLEFIDNGIGVPDERKSMIFKRGNRELKGSKGMGIGLSLVKKILKNYKGKIWVEDKVKGDYSKGSKFILLIPNFINA